MQVTTQSWRIVTRAAPLLTDLGNLSTPHLLDQPLAPAARSSSRWPDAAAAPCADGRLRPYRAAVAHGTKQVHKQASSSSSAVENLQPQQLARSLY